MKNIKLKSVHDTDITIKYFIDNELNAPHINSVIFLYCLKNWEIITTVTQICVKTNATNEQVENALEYWEAKGLCNISFSEEDNTHTINLLNKSANSVEVASPTQTTEPENQTSSSISTSNAPQTPTPTVGILKKVEYVPTELQYFVEQNYEIKQLFSNTQQSLGKILSHHEMNTLLDMHDRLKLPYELINELVNYCVLNNKRNLRSISSFAQRLSDLNILTINQFNVYVNKNKDLYKEVLKALGATNTIPSEKQRNIIDNWGTTFNYGQDVILEACDMACIQTLNPTLAYVEGILKNWFKANVKTVLDVQEYERKYLETKEQNKNKKLDLSKVKAPQKPSNFNNFESRKLDFDNIAKKLDVGYES